MSFNLTDYLPILLMFVVATGFAVTFIGLSQLVGQRKRTRTKLMPYECGKDPVGSARERFSVKFYLIAMIFILFDIEVIFLVPWAVVFRRLSTPEYGLGNVVFFEMILFIALLAALYTVAGGIAVQGQFRPTPLVNVSILAGGAVLANVIGTTGASMLLIRPLLRINLVRHHRLDRAGAPGSGSRRAAARRQ